MSGITKNTTVEMIGKDMAEFTVTYSIPDHTAAVLAAEKAIDDYMENHCANYDASEVYKFGLKQLLRQKVIDALSYRIVEDAVKELSGT